MSEYADLILLSNCIFTATEEIPFSGYIAIKNDRILSIGKGLAPTELIGTNTKYLDYGNKTITPGFSDVHCFFTGYSVGFVGIDLSAATSQEDILNSIKEYAKGIPADKPILGHGWNSDTIQPDGTDLLDEAFSTRPVLLFARGILFGLTLAHTRQHMYRSALESVAYSVNQQLKIMLEHDVPIDQIFAVGGGVKNDLWMQIVADVTGKEISTPAITVGASFGDALMAASGIKYSGFESFNKLTDFIKPGKTYHPNKENHEAYKKYQNIYDSLYPATVNLMHCLSD